MSRNKIWVIDDDRAMRWVLEKTFKEEGFDVTSFEEAQSALDQLSLDAPDVILTDIRMPGIDGLTFLAKVIFYICVTLLGVLVINVLFKNGVCCAFNKLYNKWRFKCPRK